MPDIANQPVTWLTVLGTLLGIIYNLWKWNQSDYAESKTNLVEDNARLKQRADEEAARADAIRRQYDEACAQNAVLRLEIGERDAALAALKGKLEIALQPQKHTEPH